MSTPPDATEQVTPETLRRLAAYLRGDAGFSGSASDTVSAAADRIEALEFAFAGLEHQHAIMTHEASVHRVRAEAR
jgi:tellurite resistance protein